MVSLKIAFLIIGVQLGLFNYAYGQTVGCYPTAVQDLEIFSNATLAWRIDEDEICELTQFQVDVLGDLGDEFHFKTLDTFVDLSFIEVCEQWRFTVTPISHDTAGYPQTLTEYIPLPPDADLTLDHFTATFLEERDVLLEWDLANHIHGDCSLHYRLSVSDEELGITQDVYVQGNSLHLSFLSPCIPYQLGLRAVNRARPNNEGPLLTTEMNMPAKPQQTPRISITDIQSTTITLTWIHEGGTNRCPVKALYVDSANHFNISVPVENTLNPNPLDVQIQSLRPNSMYFLRVYIENSGGVSQATQLGVQTLEYYP